jgi:replicative DNA helicase
MIETKFASESNERIALAACLHAPEQYIKVAEKLKVDHFDLNTHMLIFTAYQKVFSANKALIVSTIEPELATNRKALDTFRSVYDEELEDYKPETLEHVFEVLDDRYQARELLKLQEELEDALEDNVEPRIIIDTVSDKINRIGLNAVEQQYPIKDVLHEYIPDPRNVEPVKNEIMGVPSGIRRLDMILGGAEKGDLIYIGGRPSEGKTQLAIQWLLHATSLGHPSLIFSLETNRQRLMNRMLAHQTKIDSILIQKRQIDDSMKKKWVKGYRSLQSMPLIIDEGVGHTPFSISNIIRKHQFLYGEVGLVVIDYLQLVASDHKDLKEVTRQFQNMAKALDVPIILISQLNRALDYRDDGWLEKPKMSDFRESGSIEESGFKMLTITNEKAEDDENEEERKVSRSFIWVLKNKDGTKGRVPCMHHFDTGTFYQTQMFTKESLKKPEKAKKGDKRQHFS